MIDNSDKLYVFFDPVEDIMKRFDNVEDFAEEVRQWCLRNRDKNFSLKIKPDKNE